MCLNGQISMILQVLHVVEISTENIAANFASIKKHMRSFCQGQGHFSRQTSNLRDDPEIGVVMGWVRERSGKGQEKVR